MSIKKEFTSKAIASKAIFNVLFQIVPIGLALLLIPVLLEMMGKDNWAKYSFGISLVFLANYFSFGLGPAINRRVSELIGKNKWTLTLKEFNQGKDLAYFLGVIFLILMETLLLISYQIKSFSVLQTAEDFYFYSIILGTFFVVFLSIPIRSLLESLSDFYFLAIQRAVTASALFLIPLFVILISGRTSLILIGVGLFFYYLVLYVVLFSRAHGKYQRKGLKISFLISNIGLKDFFGIEKGFIKETMFFALFFLSNAIVVFFDRFYYSLFYDSNILADYVTILDLFNRVSIITGTISLVYFSAISVWFQESNKVRIKRTIKTQLMGVGLFFVITLLVSYFALSEIMKWWLGDSFSGFIDDNSFRLLTGCLLVNFTILILRPLQAIGEVKKASIYLIYSTILYIIFVIVLGYMKKIEYQYLALVSKALIDFYYLFKLCKHKDIV